MTQLEYAEKGITTALVKKISSLEKVQPGYILNRIRSGEIVIPNNNTRHIKKPCAIGRGLRVKINANIGTSTDRSNLNLELKKMSIAVKYGTDALMDLSIGGDLIRTRRSILRRCPVPVGTVPVYEISVNAQRKKGDFLKFDADDMLEVLANQAKEGVDFFTIHCGVTKKSVAALKGSGRLMGIVSRGGAILANWIAQNKKENPFYEHFDKILDIAREYDVTLSLGDGMRPGSILDATDKPQLTELKTLGELTLRARRHKVQVMIEGPGHVPLNQIQKNMELEKKLCHNAPFYVLGPLVTDVAAGYDHISSAIGAALAASSGADFLCYVTPSEHLRHPSVEDVKEGVIASRIAAHAADISKNLKSALEWDRKMSIARHNRDWKKQILLSVDPVKARAYRYSSMPRQSGVCTMCGNYCSIKLMEGCMRA